MPLEEIFLLAMALAIRIWRMARRHVMVRRLLAVEDLGSCTFIATDTTGILTVNRLVVHNILLLLMKYGALVAEFAGQVP